MQPVLRIRRFGVALTLFIALSAAMLGFAHRAPSAQVAQIEAYALAGLPVGEICGTFDADSHDDRHCPVCHLVGGAIVPGHAAIIADAGMVLVAEIVATRESRALRTVRDPVRSLRGPPFG